ncbi:MAG: DoxX family membrane protein [Bacteroidia bacterium]|nr:DoxX family membrane protein [Bacteroidia bacterium]
MPAPVFMVYLGKILELLAGVGLLLGLFTRAAALSLTAVMLFICFYVGKGKFYYDDQHPFLFALMGMLFFYTGPGKWSLDKIVFKNKNM